ncbi:putative quinol monooxygenase [Amycolatopsis sp. GM8]|uniref:putative quinol monooxygenase n=1 Tax=Amycolatopsis sp. GM8 TaxID=2896530 RepID=UPI001F380476|nr:putative quinol monooxygenase [Amycolatopsis sp. GM8]
MSSNDPIVVVATAVAVEGKEDQVEQAFRTAVPAVHAEPGCELYALHRDPRSPSTFVMIEKWASTDALRTHGKGPALVALGQALDGLLAEPLAVRTLTPLPAGDERPGRV